MTETVDPSRAHARAVYDLIALAWRSGKVYFGQVDDETLTFPYVAVWPPPAHRTPVNMTASVNDVATALRITAVGEAPDDVLSALDRVAAALQGVRPEIPGRSCGLIYQQQTGEPIRPDNTTRTAQGRPVFRGVAEYVLVSVPAPAAA